MVRRGRLVMAVDQTVGGQAVFDPIYFELEVALQGLPVHPHALLYASAGCDYPIHGAILSLETPRSTRFRDRPPTLFCSFSGFALTISLISAWLVQPEETEAHAVGVLLPLPCQQ